MKKILTFILIIALLLTISFVVCTKFKEVLLSKANTQNVVIHNETSTSDFIEPTYLDSNPIKLGLYLSENGKRLLQTTYTNTWKYHQDINTFNIFYTQNQEIENTAVRICYGTYLENYDSNIINEYKNGFHIHFTTTEGIVDKTILRPKDVEEFYDFLEIYLYDGYHRKSGEWYSHTTENDFDNNTTLTSIKLTSGKRVNEITSKIELTAFSYCNNDFDSNGNYRGNSKYSIIIQNKNGEN